ncbi:MAG: isoprenylcysteine carboxylmethyltransferase family protein [Lachnospiraceae bacterium]|nr:isoprenylcysteine carboxylmethyltransferase family protein [Lachnospiraceae bacterium]
MEEIKETFGKLVIISLLLNLFILAMIRPDQVENVFDEMYHSRITSAEEYHYSLFKPYHGNFRFMPQIEPREIGIDLCFADTLFEEYYRKGILGENEFLSIYCVAKTKDQERQMWFEYSYSYYNEEGHITSRDYYLYIYYVDEKLLVYETNDPENTEKKQFLFDIFLRDYFEALGYRSRYSMDNLGYFRFMDATIDDNVEHAEVYQNFSKELHYQIPAVVTLAALYACCFIRIFSQRKKGIKTAQPQKGKSIEKKGIVIMGKIAACLVSLAELVSIFCKTTGFPIWIRNLGIVTSFLGIIVFILAAMTMNDSWKTEISDSGETILVPKGIYGFSRNPAILGFDLVYIGILLLFFNQILLWITIFSIMIFHLYVVHVREPYLMSVFKDEYLAYMEKVKRYIGRKIEIPELGILTKIILILPLILLLLFLLSTFLPMFC